MPGIDWSELYRKHLAKQQQTEYDDDLEMCFFVNHDKTGSTCAVYRSLREKLVIVSFRGTCELIDIMTDATILQEPWIEGEEEKKTGKNESDIPKVHAGFRKSLSSISRRLKELLLAAVAPGDDWSDYDLLVTGHSLGGALATLFVADVAEYGLDAGRSLPQVEPSEPWWKSITNTFLGQTSDESKQSGGESPPRPKSIRLYSFGSPRVGNRAMAQKFDGMIRDGRITEAYRIVNGDDIVARNPRTMNTLVFGSVDYEHFGPTVLLTQPENRTESGPTLLWIEGESDNKQCPVRDGEALTTSPLIDGSFLAEILDDSGESGNSEDGNGWSKLSFVARKLSQRVSKMTATDLAGLLGIERQFTEREMKIFNSLVQGQGLAHHMEDEYYSGMGGACGFVAKVGEEIAELVDI